MKTLQQVQTEIRAQWDAMIQSGRIPVMEFQVSEDEYLNVDIKLSDDNTALLFSFDKDPLYEVYFSGEVEKVLNNYQITIDEYCDKLDIYLQQINGEITEGYLLPNNLYYCE